MARYLLDTTVLVDHLRGRPHVVALLRRLDAEGHQLGVCAVNVAELYSGLSGDGVSTARKMLERLVHYEITLDDAQRAGQYRYSYARKGISLALGDALVASVAVGQGATLITANTRHFPMEDLQVMDHRSR